MTTEKQREAMKRYRRTAKFKAARARYRTSTKGRTTKARYRATPKLKEQHRAQVHARRHLKAQPCMVCGTTKNVEAHHPDYSKPLEVRWLCEPHHKQEHCNIKVVAAAIAFSENRP